MPGGTQERMFGDELWQAISAAPRAELLAVSSLLWRAYAAGHMTEVQVSELSETIEAKRAIPTLQSHPRGKVGPRPKTPESLARRR